MLTPLYGSLAPLTLPRRRIAAAVAAWSPPSDTVFWMNETSLRYQDSAGTVPSLEGDLVNRINDVRGAEYPYTITPDSRRPFTATFSGSYITDFGSGNAGRYLTYSNDAVIVSGGTLLIVYRLRPGAANQTSLLHGGDRVQSPCITGDGDVRFTPGNPDTAVQIDGGSLVVPPETWGIIDFTHSDQSGITTLRYNGAVYATASGISWGPSRTIAADYNNNTLGGDVAELVGIRRPLENAERESATSHLMTKWGITSTPA